MKGNEARQRWAERFGSLLNVVDDMEADVAVIGCVGIRVFRD